MKKFLLPAFILLMVGSLSAQSYHKLVKKGDRALFSEKYYKSVDYYEEALDKKKKKDPYLYLKLGICLLELSQDREALTALEMAYELDNRVDPDIYYYLGAAYQINGFYKEALECFQRMKKQSLFWEVKFRKEIEWRMSQCQKNINAQDQG